MFDSCEMGGRCLKRRKSMEVEFGIGRNAKDGESICGLLGTRAAPDKGKGKGKGKGGGTKIHEVFFFTTQLPPLPPPPTDES